MVVRVAVVTLERISTTSGSRVMSMVVFTKCSKK
jgi:hypothetical protein